MNNPLAPLLETLAPPLDRIEDYLDHWADATPDAEACVEGEERLSYRDLRRRVDALAARLHANGVGKGSIVATLAPPSADFLTSFLATSRLGAVWLGLNPKYTQEEMLQLVADAKPAVLLARPDIAGRSYDRELTDLAALGNRILLFGEEAAPATPLLRASNPVAALVYTSGSTGVPKGAQLTQKGLIRGAQVRSAVWKVEPFRTINNVPINHVGGLGDLACTTLVSGGCQVFLEKFTAQDTLAIVAREGITYWYQAPTMFQMCLDDPLSDTMDWSRLQAAIWSGGRASEGLIRRLASVADRIGVDYSMSESIGAITLSPLTDDPEDLFATVGWPDPGRAIRIAAAGSDMPVSQGQQGEIQIGDAWMFAGYHGQPAQSGWFSTGDLGTQAEDGSIRITGRLKDMFKSGGYNVYPREIEQLIESLPGVRAAAVLTVADPLFGEVGVAVVACSGGASLLAEIEGACRVRLANYKVPKRFVSVDELPMLPVGKVDKQALVTLISQ
jgi:acyl-CoA synthetase (AMP-forming)/AMP-acid ligase II